MLVACIPVAVLGMGAALAHMIMREHHRTEVRIIEPPSAPAAPSEPETVRSGDTVHTVSVREFRSETHSTAGGLPPQPPLIELESGDTTPFVVTGAQDRWAQIAETVCTADPAGRRDPDKVATILRLKFVEHWSHSRIAEHVELSPSAVTRTLTAAKEHVRAADDADRPTREEER